MSSKIKVLAAVTGLFMVLTGAAYAKNENSIQVKGSDTMVNLVQSWAEEFMKVHPDSFIAVTGGGSGTGIASIINGTCDQGPGTRARRQKRCGPQRI
jgi:phosphate transport system substrate-binding protein